MKLHIYLLAIVSTLLLFGSAQAGDLPKGLKDLSIGGNWYLSHISGEDSNGENYDQWAVTRAYVNIKKKGITPYLDSRITLDAHMDAEGDMEVRLKYAYAHFKFGDMGFITKPNLELGLVHTPWLDFEQKINRYRMRGKMFIERSGLFNSADFGFTFGGNFGGEMDKDYQKSVSKGYPGRFGSFAVGAYNGGGYHATEENLNKVIEARVSIRPVPEVAPGMQLSYFGTFGQGNQSVDIQEWKTNLAMLSYEHQMFTLAGQYTFGQGNQKGTWADSVDYSGYSLFAEGKFIPNWLCMFNYDSFDRNVDMDDDAITRIIVGVGYDFGSNNILLFDYETVGYEMSGVDNSKEYKLTMQINY